MTAVVTESNTELDLDYTGRASAGTGEHFHDRRGITGMTKKECKRHLYDAAAAWLSASSLDELNVDGGLSDAAETRWEAAKREVAAELFKRGSRV